LLSDQPTKRKLIDCMAKTMDRGSSVLSWQAYMGDPA
jgi:hypothetical protein